MEINAIWKLRRVAWVKIGWEKHYGMPLLLLNVVKDVVKKKKIRKRA